MLRTSSFSGGVIAIMVLTLWLQDGAVVVETVDSDERPVFKEDCACDEEAGGEIECTHCTSTVPQLQLTVPSGTLSPGSTSGCASCAELETVYVCDLAVGTEGACTWASPLVTACDGNVYRWTIELFQQFPTLKGMYVFLEIRNADCTFTRIIRFAYPTIPGVGPINCGTAISNLSNSFQENAGGTGQSCRSSSGKTVTVDAI